MSDGSRIDQLTPKQRQCLDLVGQGFKSKQIGRILGRSPSTIDNHIFLACQVLGINDRDEAARALAAEQAGQGLPRFSPSLADAVTIQPINRSIGRRLLRWSIGLYPPIGGKPNDLSGPERMAAIGRIAILSVVVFVITVIFIATTFRILR